MKKISLKEIFIFIIFLLLSYFIRLDKINASIFINHSWHQSERYAISLNFAEKGRDFFSPKTFSVFSFTNNSRLFTANPPFYEYLLSIFMNSFGNSLFVARLFSILISSFITYFVYLIGKKLFNERIGFFSGLILNFSPLFIFWGASISPELFATLLSLIAIFLTLKSRKLQLLSLIFLSIATATKPYFLVLLIPIFYMCQSKNKKMMQFMFKSLLVILPYVLWNIYTKTISSDLQYKMSIFDYVSEGKNVLFYLRETNWVHQFFIKRFFVSLQTLFVAFLSIHAISLFIKNKTYKTNILLIWFFSSLIPIFFIVWGNLNHDYNQIFILPVLSLMAGFSLNELVEVFSKKKTS